MKQVRFYKIGSEEPVAELNVRNVYEDVFYHRPMPTISGRRCRKIIRQAGTPVLIAEWADTGYRGLITLHEAGTVMNF